MRITVNVPGSGLTEVELAGKQIGSIRAVDAEDHEAPFISPGFIDIQMNGFMGLNFSGPDMEPEEIVEILPSVWKTGVTTFCPTLMTGPHESLVRSLRALEKARQIDPRFARSAPCYHLEGPYLSPGPARGAHDITFMRPPSWDELLVLQEAAGNRIGMITVAPELPGAFDFIRKATESGITIALGHTDATPEEIHRAAECGAKLSTHLGNGSPQQMDRHHAPFWAQLADDRLCASIICDTFHLPQELVQIIGRVKGTERCILVTDASFVAGLSPGVYRSPNAEVELLSSGQVVTIDRRCMAGSAIGLNRAMHVFMEFGAGSMADAVAAATKNPARLLPSNGITGHLREGELANLVVFRRGARELDVERVFLGGEEIYRK
jgi:N-acetylglucosamine-6-phosphate deacetylase